MTFFSPSVNYKISFPADYKNIAPLRDLGYHIAKFQGFSEQKAEHGKSVIDELCNNAIEHGSQSTSEVSLEIFADGDTLKITCHDQGHGNKLKAEQITELLEQEIPQDAARGRGLRMIVKSFVDDLQVTDNPNGGITVTAVLKK